MAMLTYDVLRDAIAGTGIGVRARTRFDPLGGPGDKVFPPTYGVRDSAETRYAIEDRIVNGELKRSVVLDSVASQANRLEIALLEAFRAGDIALPVVSVDFRTTEDLEDMDRISSLEASHRVFDALLRDSLNGDVMFRLSDVGRSITEASSRNAAALLKFAPTTLLFGGWDSTGPKGGKGAKYERAITSEVVGIGVVSGVKTSSRIDPAGIELKAGPVYEAADQSLTSWTLTPSEAVKEKGKAKEYKGGGEGGSGRPSQINHGNVTPSIDSRAGGVTVEEIVATTVLSFIQLRRLRFPVDAEGRGLDGDTRRAAELAAWTSIAALGLAAATLAFEQGFDLRSRCVLVPNGELVFELLHRAGTTCDYTLDGAAARKLLKRAQEEAAGAGLAWANGELLLKPTDRLAELIRRSRLLAATPSAARSEDD